MSQSPSECFSAGRGFYKEREGKQTKEINGKGLKSSPMCRLAQSIQIRPQNWSRSGLACIILVENILVLHLEVSKPPRAEMTECQCLYLLKLVPRILTQTCCLSTSYILVRVSIYRNNVERMAGWVTNTRCYTTKGPTVVKKFPGLLVGIPIIYLDYCELHRFLCLPFSGSFSNTECCITYLLRPVLT